MINVSEATKQAWLSDRKVNTVEIAFPNLSLTFGIDDIDKDNFSLKESLCNADSMEFVGCIASSLKVAIYNISDNVKGEQITVSIKAGATETIPLFIGYVDSVEIDADSRFKTIIAYDALYNAGQVDVAQWYARLPLPMTLGAIRESLMSYVGLTEVEGTVLPNDNVTIYRTLENPDTIQALTVIKSICQLNGACGIINREGEFEYRYVQTTMQTSYLLPFFEKLKYEEYFCNAIQRVQIRDTEDDAGVVTSNSGNKYIVQANMFAYELATSTLYNMANNILAKINGFTYHPMRSIQNGLPFMEVGDTIEYSVSEAGYGIDTFLILSRTLTGIQFCRDTFESRGTQNQSEYISDLQAQVDVLKRTTNELKNLSSKIVDYILPTNIEESDIASGSSSDVLEFNFYCNDEEEKSSFYATFNFTISTNADLLTETYGDCTLTVTYIKDGTNVEVQTHTFGDGSFMVMLNYLLSNMGTGNHTFKIRFALSGGSMSSIQSISAYLLAATAVESGNYEEEYDIEDNLEFADYMFEEDQEVLGDFIDILAPTGGSGDGTNFSGNKFCDDWMAAFTRVFEYSQIRDSIIGATNLQYPSTEDESDWSGFTVEYSGATDLIPKRQDAYVFATYGKHINMWVASCQEGGYFGRTFQLWGAYIENASFQCKGNYPRQGYAVFNSYNLPAHGTYQDSREWHGRAVSADGVTFGSSMGNRISTNAAQYVLVYNVEAFKTYLSGLDATNVNNLANSWFVLAECNIKKEKAPVQGVTDWSDNDDYHGE